MKSLKATFAFFIPLLSMLIAFCIYLLITNIVDNYKSKISKDYSIVVVSKIEFKKDDFGKLAGINVSDLKLLSNEKIIENIKSNLSSSSITLLRTKLPYFYQLYLENFPTSTELEKIKKTLLSKNGVKTVEIFYKNHSQVYILLLILSTISFSLFIIITIFAVIILAKQIKLWFHEHRVKIAILRLHGASIIYSASSIIKQAFLSSFLAFLVSSGVLIYISNNIEAIFPFELQDIVNIEINLEIEILKIFALAFIISLCTIFGTLLKYKIDND
ncbi:FtsX-like permease family protein [Arcobacter porcinus]|uniref:Cell division protein FtsX n=1 Tax=Arcobacter porcinus TaxID=1935204 RepID=A0A1C0B0T5_9BACT|nr:FtsX-like permease family protein [Arcobacter porcinus]OCL91419.1 hypothetical protein AAX27_01366 [Aliarcobacter thereius]OCL82448.1 hypothetical protein AAW29_01391 [Arcobacter porcinus]OCL82563.1 hypothetical protein AAW30_01387 [Arcobacter porcinus]OCL87306.1 hypothetical protein AAX30_01075 [Arcobacter porcinus]OCL93320.1 hypothetical protein AAX28_00863 [Arcobacter porcinus]